MYHFTKFPREGFSFLESAEERISYYKDDFVYPCLSDGELIEKLCELFTLKRITIGEMQPNTFRNEMILGSHKPYVYTVLWELVEDEKSVFFYKWRREHYHGRGFDVSGKIVVFHAPWHPYDMDIPAAHFASNDEPFSEFINVIRGVERNEVEKGSMIANVYAGVYCFFDRALTERFGYGYNVPITEKDDRRI